MSPFNLVFFAPRTSRQTEWHLSNFQSLVEYYRDELGFADGAEMATAKPLYDLSCKFMYQEAATLEERRKEFFDHFNSEE